MTRGLIIGTAVVVGICLIWLGYDGWAYLQRGYSLQVGMIGAREAVFHVDFPVWLTAMHATLWVVSMAAIIGYITAKRWAATLAWLSFVAAIAIGLYDIVEYGTIGSPMSVWVLVLLLLLGLLTTLAPAEKSADA